MSKTKPQPYLADASEQLLLAAADGDAARVRASLAAGAYINASNYNKQTALIRAAFFGHYDVVRLLLAAAADPQVKDKVGLTAFDWSIARGFHEIAHLLRAAPAADPQIAPTKEAAPPVEPPAATSTSLPLIESARVPEPVTEVVEPATKVAEPVTELAAGPSVQPKPAQPDELATESTLYESPAPELKEADTQPVSEVAAEPTWYESLPELKEPDTQAVSEIAADPTWYSPELKEDDTHPVNEVAAESTLFESPSPEPKEPDTQPVSGPAAPTTFSAATQPLDGDKAIASEQVTEPVTQARLDEAPAQLLGEPFTQPPGEPAVQAQLDAKVSAASTQRLEVSDQSSANSSARLQAPAIPKASQTNPRKVSTGRPAVHLGPTAQQGHSILWSLLAVAALAGITVAYLTFRPQPAEPPAQTTSANPPKVAEPAGLKNSPIVQGEIKGSEISLPEPEYPTAAKKQGLTGSIGAAVTVNSKGKVVLVRTSKGPALLRQAAQAAALKAVFKPQEGAARRSGTITYSFGGISSEPAADTTVTNQPQPVEAAEVKIFVEGDLKGSEISLPQPPYPARAKSKEVAGSIAVAIVVNNKGRVVAARSSQGPPQLRNVARTAALKATFKPFEGARRSGTITYNFGKAKLNRS